MSSTGKTASRFEMDMCNGAIFPKLITFALPLMASNILQLLFNAIDIIVVGRFTGSEALAAVGATTSLLNIYINLFIGISLGVNVMAARYYATKDTRALSETVHTAISFAIISGICMLFIGIATAKITLRWMDTPQNVIDQSVLYMRIYFCGMPFFMTYNYGAAILRAIGDTRRPLIFLFISGLVNALLNMFLVIVFHLGVAGVAIATAISQGLSCIMVTTCLCKSDGPYKLYFSKLHLNVSCLKQIIKIGLPSGIQSVVINFSNVLLQSSVNSFGSVSMAGYTAANNLFGILYASVNAITQSCMSFTSQNYGLKKMKRVDRILIDCCIFTVIVSLIIGCSFYGFGNYILRIYSDDSDVIKAGMEILAIACPLYFICGIMDLFPGSLRGMGHSGVPMVLSIIGTVGLRIFWIFLVFPFHHSLTVLFISYPVSWALTVVMQLICFLLVRKKELR